MLGNGINYQDQLRGALLGGALGDAIGLPIEDKNAEEVQVYLDQFRQNPEAAQAAAHARWVHLTSMGGSVATPKRPMQISDDTLCLEAIYQTAAASYGWFNVEDYAKRYAALMRPNGFGGATTKAALARIRQGVPATEAADGARVRDPQLQPSNGAAMAAVADGVLGAFVDRRVLLLRVRQRACVTHRHPEAVLAAELLAVTGWWLAQPNRKGRVRPGLVDMLQETFPEWGRALAQLAEPVTEDTLAQCHAAARVACRPSGAGGLPAHALVGVLWVLRRFCQTVLAPEPLPPDEALLQALVPGGDTDTVGCMMGSLLGAWYGYAQLADMPLLQTVLPLLHDNGTLYQARLLALADAAVYPRRAPQACG